MNSLKKHFSSIFFVTISIVSLAQEGTRTTEKTDKKVTGQVCIVPFEPKVYMSEIDKKINDVTKWNWEAIRENFRRQLDAQIKLKIQSSFSVVSFYIDSAKMAKDLEYIYTSTNISYDLVSAPSDARSTSKTKSGISNGQIMVEQNNDQKFMNTKLTNTEVIPYMNKKYLSDYFIFINELDIKNNMNSYDITTDTYQRDVIVHYSILDKNGKTINAGIATSQFSSKENNPKKIVAQCFSPISTYIATKLTETVNPKTTTPKH